MLIPADTRAIHLNVPRGRSAHFRPNGERILVGKEVVTNPSLWDTEEPMLAARLFVGFNVGETPTWSVDDLIPIVTTMRIEQGHSADASYLIQKGVYTHKDTGLVVIEDGAQVILLNTSNEPQKDFEREVMTLAEKICRDLKQAEVIVEIQRGGLSVRTFGVGP